MANSYAKGKPDERKGRIIPSDGHLQKKNTPVLTLVPPFQPGSASTHLPLCSPLMALCVSLSTWLMETASPSCPSANGVHWFQSRLVPIWHTLLKCWDCNFWTYSTSGECQVGSPTCPPVSLAQFRWARSDEESEDKGPSTCLTALGFLQDGGELPENLKG